MIVGLVSLLIAPRLGFVYRTKFQMQMPNAWIYRLLCSLVQISMGCHTFLGMPISSRLALGGCSVYHCRPKRDRSVCPPHPNCVQVGCFECVCSERDVIAGCVHLRCTRSVGCVCPVFVTVDEVGLGSSSFPSAGAVLFVCVDLAWDPVMRFVCFLCGIRFSEH